MTPSIEEATRQFESRFSEVIDGPPTKLAKYGLPYETYASGCDGPCPEGVEKPGFPDADSAINSWLWATAELSGRVLYWRWKPELSEYKGKWYVYSRLAVEL